MVPYKFIIKKTFRTKFTQLKYKTLAISKGKITSDLPIIVGLVGVCGTRSQTFALIQQQVVIAAGTTIRPVLATGAVRVAGNARPVGEIYKARPH